MGIIKKLAVGTAAIAVGCSSTFLSAPGLANASATAPDVDLSSVAQISSNQQSCLTKYEAGPLVLGTVGITATFTNYVAGTKVEFRISNPAGGWLTHVVDFVSSPSRCNNLVVSASGTWFPVTIPSGLNSLQIIGLPDSYLTAGGNFQSRYVSGASASSITITPIISSATTTKSATTSSTCNISIPGTSGILPSWACHADSPVMSQLIKRIFDWTPSQQTTSWTNCPTSGAISPITHRVDVGDNSLGDFIISYVLGEFGPAQANYGTPGKSPARYELLAHSILENNSTPACKCINQLSVIAYLTTISTDLGNGTFTTAADKATADDLMTYLREIQGLVLDSADLAYYSNISENLGWNYYIWGFFALNELYSPLIKGYLSVSSDTKASIESALCFDPPFVLPSQMTAAVILHYIDLLMSNGSSSPGYVAALADLKQQMNNPGVDANPCTVVPTSLQSWIWQPQSSANSINGL